MKNRGRRNRKFFTWWLVVFSFMLVGCGAERWSPTDPRVQDPNKQETVIIHDHVEVNVGAEVTP